MIISVSSRIVMASKNTWVELDWWKIYRIILFWHSTKTLVKVRWNIWKIKTIAWIKYICICRIIQFDLVLFFESDTVYYTPFINNKFEQMGILFKKQLVVSAAALIYFFVVIQLILTKAIRKNGFNINDLKMICTT